MVPGRRRAATAERVRGRQATSAGGCRASLARVEAGRRRREADWRKDAAPAVVQLPLPTVADAGWGTRGLKQ